MTADTPSTTGSKAPRPDGTPRAETARAETARLAVWAMVALVVALFRNRLWATPNLAIFSELSKHLGSNPFEGSGIGGDYLLTNVLGQAIARLLGSTDPHLYVRVHLGLFLVATALVVALTHRRFGYLSARTLVVALAAAPGTTVVMQWLGQPDALTFPLAMSIVIARSWPARVALGVLLGLSHSEQGFAAALIAVVVSLAIDLLGDAPTAEGPGTIDPAAAKLASRVPLTWITRPRLAAATAPLLGVAAGRMIVEGYLRLNDITISTSRTSFLSIGVQGFAEHHRLSPGWLIYSLWGPLWVAVAALALWCSRSPRATGAPRHAAVLLGIGAFASLAPMLITLDQTRVYSMVSAPVLAGAAILVGIRVIPSGGTVPSTRSTSPANGSAWISAAALVVALLVPGMFNAGEAYFATDLPVGPFVDFLVHGTVPDDDLTGFLLAPFPFEIPGG